MIQKISFISTTTICMALYLKNLKFMTISYLYIVFFKKLAQLHPVALLLKVLCFKNTGFFMVRT